jgi:hypothetical protein
VSILREWAEEHWAAVGVVGSIAGALALSLVIAVTFNIVVTRADRMRADVAPVAPPVSARAAAR